MEEVLKEDALLLLLFLVKETTTYEVFQKGVKEMTLR